MKVLLVQNARLQTAEAVLKAAGMNLAIADCGEDAIDLGKAYEHDLVILNAVLPDMSGVEVLRTLRAAKISTPVLMLSAAGDIAAKVKAFTMGADDYLTVPYHNDELVARIHAIVRRSQGIAEEIVTIGKLAVNLTQKTVCMNGQEVYLTIKQYQVLELLCLRRRRVVTREQFFDHLYGGVSEPCSKIVDVYICKLRKRLADVPDAEDYIEAVWGRGFVLREPSEKVIDVSDRPNTSTYVRRSEFNGGRVGRLGI
jgi:two-component system cell cycle response regulator CtrA